MAKLTVRQIRQRAIELLQANLAGMRTSDLILTIASEHPEANLSTINTQVHRLPRSMPTQVTRLDRGLLALLPGHAVVELVSEPTASPVRRFPNSADALIVLGFEMVGSWHLDDNGPTFQPIARQVNGSFLYAFVVDGEVVYIGRSARTLRERMFNYQSPGPNQAANIRLNGQIRQALGKGKSVQVYALSRFESMQHRGIPLDMAAALEGPLIERMRPTWNRTL